MPTVPDDLPDGLRRLEVRELHVTLEGLVYAANNKDFYSKLFQSTNISVSGPYVKKFYNTKDGHKV